jgi:hypothetical protein
MSEGCGLRITRRIIAIRAWRLREQTSCQKSSADS